MSKTANDITLGPFRILQPLATGGMGEVWAGEHIAQGVPVAVKFITGNHATDPRYLRAFKKEVSAAAGLHHPSIITVYDGGLVTEQAAAASGRRLVAGSPYLVMERATCELGNLKVPFTWEPLKELLLAVLDALAHAHAQGVVHRDLKPGNVLFSDRGLGLRVKLTDFGISHALGHTHTEQKGGRFAGTPAYVAPEQLIGTASDTGPWTDLYSLGIIAYELASGKHPFDGESFIGLIRAHLATVPPTLQLQGYPAGFGAWVARLLEKSPIYRFHGAADAAWKLMQLPSNSNVAQRLGSGEVPDFQRQPLAAGQTQSELTLGLSEISDVVLGQPLEADIRLEDVESDRGNTGDAPTLPADWRMALDHEVEVPLLGTGLGLFGVKGVPIVGREHERGQLWAALVKVHTERRPYAIELSGPAGLGKTRLAAWFARRAFEVGGAVVLRVHHAKMGVQGSGLVRMVAKYLRCSGLPREEAKDRIRWFLRTNLSLSSAALPASDRELDWPDSLNEEAEGLVEFISAHLYQGSTATREGETPTERRRQVMGLIQRVCRERPVIFWLEDAQWGSESLELALSILKEGAELPLLILSTVNTDALAGRPLEAAQLEEMAETGRSEVVLINRLPSSDIVRLVQTTLGLERSLAAAVEARCSGNPLFALQLVGDWVERRLLQAERSGFVLKPGADISLPANVTRLWEERLEQAALETSPAILDVLELGAALGREISLSAWTSVCGAGHLRSPHEFLDTLEQLHLIRVWDDLIVFSHGMLHEALTQRAIRGGKWAAYHRLCANTFERATQTRDIAERLAYHWSEAGEPESAEVYLLVTSRARAEVGEYRQALDLLERRESLLSSSKIDENDRRRVEGRLAMAIVGLKRGHSKEAAHIAAIGAFARDRGWEDLRVDADIALGFDAGLRGDYRRGRQAYERALAWLRTDGTPARLAEALVGFGDLEGLAGHLEEATAHLEAAAALYQSLGDDHGVGATLNSLAIIDLRGGDLLGAQLRAEEAQSYLEFVGSRRELGRNFNLAGELARAQGKLTDAYELYSKAWYLLDAVGASDAAIIRLNLGLLALACERPEHAREHLEAGSLECERTGQTAFQGASHAGLMACAAMLGQWDEFDTRYALATHWLQEAPMNDEDIARSACLAGDYAVAEHQFERARLSFLLAREQWFKLHKLDSVDAIDATLASLPSEPKPQRSATHYPTIKNDD